MIPVTKTYMPPIEEYSEYLQKIWSNGWLTNNGPLEHDLAEKLSSYLGVQYLDLVSNGTIAIQLAIKSLNLTGEIITTPFSYVATTSAILWEGCSPIFVDIDSQTFCIDPNLIERAITPKTSAILATHVYGNPCAVNEIEEIALRHGLKVIYDAAHCFGVLLNGRSIMDYGDIATTSFHATKLFHTAEGGAVICRDADVAQRVFLLKKFGHLGEEQYIDIGINAKMSELHAAMGLCMLPRISEIISERKRLSGIYDELLRACVPMSKHETVDFRPNYSYYPVSFSSPEAMLRTKEKLIANQVIPRRYFYPSLNRLPYLGRASFQRCPISEQLALKVLCLPLYVGLSEKEVLRVANLINEES